MCLGERICRFKRIALILLKCKEHQSTYSVLILVLVTPLPRNQRPGPFAPRAQPAQRADAHNFLLCVSPPSGVCVPNSKAASTANIPRSGTSGTCRRGRVSEASPRTQPRTSAGRSASRPCPQPHFHTVPPRFIQTKRLTEADPKKFTQSKLLSTLGDGSKIH